MPIEFDEVQQAVGYDKFNTHAKTALNIQI